MALVETVPWLSTTPPHPGGASEMITVFLRCGGSAWPWSQMGHHPFPFSFFLWLGNPCLLRPTEFGSVVLAYGTSTGLL